MPTPNSTTKDQNHFSTNKLLPIRKCVYIYMYNFSSKNHVRAVYFPLGNTQSSTSYATISQYIVIFGSNNSTHKHTRNKYHTQLLVHPIYGYWQEIIPHTNHNSDIDTAQIITLRQYSPTPNRIPTWFYKI